jgi:hypothetical protein
VSLTNASSELSNGLKTMRLLWEETLTGWKDSVRADFEARHWDPLEAQVRATIQALDRLAPVLARARHECS